VLTIVMLIAAVGAGAHQQEGSCPMSNLPDCCKKARSHGPEAAMARLCCNLNCSEPGSTGNSNSSSFSAQQGAAPNLPVVPGVAQFDLRIVLHRHSQQVHVSDSNPKYITHLALLI
jgi:hypothetical protein